MRSARRPLWLLLVVLHQLVEVLSADERFGLLHTLGREAQLGRELVQLLADLLAVLLMQERIAFGRAAERVGLHRAQEDVFLDLALLRLLLRLRRQLFERLLIVFDGVSIVACAGLLLKFECGCVDSCLPRGLPRGHLLLVYLLCVTTTCAARRRYLRERRTLLLKRLRKRCRLILDRIDERSVCRRGLCERWLSRHRHRHRRERGL